MATPITKGWRRILRLSLRSLVAVVMIIGGWLGWIVRDARIQNEAVAEIRRLQGTVRYDWERKDGRSVANGRPWGPKWLVERLNIDYFGHVTQVRLVASHQLSDADLVRISHLKKLEELDLHRSPVTDQGLVHLEGMTELQSLVLFHTGISDAGLEHLKGLTRLKTLSIENTNVSDAGVRELQRALPNLTISR
jgi:hypothetical protein